MKKNRKSSGKAVLFFSIILTVVILDQLTKWLIIQKKLHIIFFGGFLRLIASTNTGAAFSLLKGQNSFLMFVALIVIGFIFYYYPRIPEKNLPVSSLALIAGGAIGNLIDRIAFGHVIDFISFSFWPSFNVADSAISIGAVLLVVWILKNEK